MPTRRVFLAAAAGAATLTAAKSPVKTIVLRSGWQSINIGDVTHTPGVLSVIERHMPDARVFLWPQEVERGAQPMIEKRFPNVSVVKSGIAADGTPDSSDMREIFKSADLFLHGSAAGVGSLPQIESWKKSTSKPYGFFGVTFTLSGEAASAKLEPKLERTLRESKFVFTRETVSLSNLGKAKIAGPKQGFAPDGTFSFDIRDDDKGHAFLATNNLEPNKFICVLPRLRYTPYHRTGKAGYGKEEADRRDTYNARFIEADHAKLREAVVAYVKQTGHKVLLCPEMTYALDLLEPMLYRPLPEDVKPNVVVRKNFWLPDEAASIYSKAVAVVSAECHSPIIASVNGTPCIYVHQAEDGIKGNMWPDIGLKDWYLQMDDTTGSAIGAKILEISANLPAAKRKVKEAVLFAQLKQDEAMGYVTQLLG